MYAPSTKGGGGGDMAAARGAGGLCSSVQLLLPPLSSGSGNGEKFQPAICEGCPALAAAAAAAAAARGGRRVWACGHRRALPPASITLPGLQVTHIQSSHPYQSCSA